MHELIHNKFHTINNVDDFISEYMGAIRRAQIDNINHLNFKEWSNESKLLFRDILNFFAEAIPKADHVIRNDFDKRGHLFKHKNERNLFMYIGVQASIPRSVSQFIAISFPHTSPMDANGNMIFTFSIAGATTEDGFSERIRNYDPKQCIHEKTITTRDEFKQNSSAFTLVSDKMTKDISSLKLPGVYGYSIHTSQLTSRNANNIKSIDDAGKILSKYWESWKINKTQNEIKTTQQLLGNNNNLRRNACVRFIFEGFTTEDAFEKALNISA